jgi:hypothetical protein
VPAISRRLGHGSPTITLAVYGHRFSTSDDQAAKIMEAAFARPATECERPSRICYPAGGNPVAIASFRPSGDLLSA